MTVAVWIIAICEVIRAAQNFIQLRAIKSDAKGRENAYAEFVRSLKQTDKEFVRALLDEFERQEGAHEG